jgi:ankyrin repeat protein
MKVRVVLFAFVLVCVSSGVFASDVGLPAAGTGSGAGAPGGYVEVVDEDGLLKLNSDLMRELACKKVSDDDGRTLLHIAAQYSANAGLNTVRCLCYWGADVNAQDAEGRTPLHIAAYWGHDHIMTYLRACGADITLVNSEGKTAYDVFRETQGREYADVELKLEPLFGKEMRARSANLLRDSELVKFSDIDVELRLMCGAE